MLLNLDEFIDLINVKSTVKICRDYKDDFLLALVKDGKADYLLSGDKDLLDLKKYGKTQIETFTSFWDKESRKTLWQRFFLGLGV